jgi:hypothetical protein
VINLDIFGVVFSFICSLSDFFNQLYTFLMSNISIPLVGSFSVWGLLTGVGLVSFLVWGLIK